MKTFVGIVEKGSGQAGKLFGLPTANIAMAQAPTDIAPGVYVSRATIQDHIYPALTFIGQAHLLPGKPWRLETHLFGASGDFTGAQLSIQLLHQQRPSIAFSSPEQASDVIKQDIADAHAYFKTNP